MKKAFTLVVLIVTPTMAFAQGTVGFINNTAGLVRQCASSTDPTPISAPVGGVQLELLTAPAGTPFNPIGTYVRQDTVMYFIPYFFTLSSFLTANPGWSAIATTGITPVAGRFNGGTLTLPGVAGGANAEYIVIGWTGGSATWDAAFTSGAMFGSSAMFTIATGNPATTPPGTATLLSATLTGTFPVPNTGVFVTGIPEPTTFALAGLGALTLMIYRRRR